MANKPVITVIVLWAWVLSASILTGGGIFEHTVLSPLWQGSLPESVRSWPYGGVQRQFFIFASPIYYFCSVALLIVSFWMPRHLRIWARIAGVSGLVVAVATFGYFLPILNQTQSTRGAGLSDDEIVRLVTQFKSFNFLRFAVIIGGWICGLQAFRLSSAQEGRNQS